MRIDSPLFGRRRSEDFPQLSLAERQWKIERSNSGRVLTNEGIWGRLVRVAHSNKSRNYVTQEDLVRVAQAYLDTYKEGPVSVSDLVVSAGGEPLRDPYFSVMSFNYDWEAGGSDRLKEAFEAFNQGTTSSVDMNCPEHTRIEQWFEIDLDHMADTNSFNVARRRFFNRESQRSETGYFYERIWLDELGHGDAIFKERVLSLIGQNELIKAGKIGYYRSSESPLIVKKS